MLGLSYAIRLSPRIEKRLATLFTPSPSRVGHPGDPYTPALNAVGGQVFRLKTRARARGHVAAPDPSWVKCRAGGPGTPDYLRRALPSLGHVVPPDPPPSREQVRGRWPGEVDSGPQGSGCFALQRVV